MIIVTILLVFIGLLSAAVAAAYITNPFSRLSIVKLPFTLRAQQNGEFKVLNENHKLQLHQNLLWRIFAILKCGIHVVTTRYVHSPAAPSTTVNGIISDIHAHRFRPDRLLLTSGDHFSALFVRNLGVFYYPTLDVHTPSTMVEWQNRQITYLQTVAYALGVFAKYKKPVTTIVPTGPYAATCVNIYAYPSDAVYGVLYAVAALLGKEPATAAANTTKPFHTLQTQAAAQLLLDEYQGTMGTVYAHYRDTVWDEQTGLIRTNIHLSGAKDITRRTSAFFDNVIFWKTTELAMRLGLIPANKAFLLSLKKRILKTFWLEDKGYFLEDLSSEGVQNSYYSSDWLIVLITGFLSPEKPSERHYFERSVAYIQAKGIDKPFAIKYQHETRAHRQFIAVRLTMASYGGDAIWSFWGMEYIKVLMSLYRQTGQKSYLAAADYHIHAYEKAMLRDHGFPEVYDKDGALLETPIYRSIRQTGWVIGFEQVRAQRATIS